MKIHEAIYFPEITAIQCLAAQQFNVSFEYVVQPLQ